MKRSGRTTPLFFFICSKNLFDKPRALASYCKPIFKTKPNKKGAGPGPRRQWGLRVGHSSCATDRQFTFTLGCCAPLSWSEDQSPFVVPPHSHCPLEKVGRGTNSNYNKQSSVEDPKEKNRLVVARVCASLGTASSGPPPPSLCSSARGLFRHETRAV